MHWKGIGSSAGGMAFVYNEDNADLSSAHVKVPNADPTLRNAFKEHFQIFSKGLYNVKTENLMYRNHCGMNATHLHLPWVDVEGSTHVQSPRPASSS